MPVVKIPNKKGVYSDIHDLSRYPHPQAKEVAKIISKKTKQSLKKPTKKRPKI